MKCHYCGKEVWLVRHLLDGDFCSPAHRKQYHDRLRRSLEQLPKVAGPPAPIAGFQVQLSPAASEPACNGRGAGLITSWPNVRLPEPALGLSPIFGQSFFGPDASHAHPAAAARAPAHMQPVVAPPRLDLLNRSFRLAVQPSIATGDRFLPGRAVAVELGAPALPICSPPQEHATLPAVRIVPPAINTAVLADALPGVTPPAELRHLPIAVAARPAAPAQPVRLVPQAVDRSPRELLPPGMIAGVLADAPADAVPQVELRHLPLAAALAARLEALNGAAGCASTPQRWLPVRSQPPAQLNGLHLVPCSPIRFRFALLAEDTVACAAALPARVASVPVATAAHTPNPPALPAAIAARLEGEAGPIWKIAPAMPGNLAQQITAQPASLPGAAAALPGMVLAPVRPGLAAEGELRPIDAPPRMVPALASSDQGSPIEAAPRTAAEPPMNAPQLAAALPEALAPRPVATARMAPRETVSQPASTTAVPISAPARPALESLAPALAPCLEICAGPPLLLLSAGPLASQVPAFIPQAAGPRAAGELAVGGPATPDALPLATAAGFGPARFAELARAAAGSPLRPVMPAPQPLAREPLSFGRIGAPAASAGMPPVHAAVPLDVYVQRVRSTPRREHEWKPVPARALPPASLPGLWPSRFEQQVLQDWRRRYPARQVALAPEPVTAGPKVVPISQGLSALDRLRRTAPHFLKATAAAAVIGAIIWLSGSARGVKSAVSSNQHWLRDAIAQRAALVLDDNFRSGLNLWEGRHNWARSWAYSPDGFVRTGQLALYRPSMGLTDYRLEFFAQIESKSVGWVFRAKDEQNYYAMKLSVTEPGPRPLVSVVRYPVSAGHKGKRVQIPLPIMMHNSTPYRVALDVRGSRFRAFVEDQEVDSWSDDRLRSGGVGFFSETGEHARLYWVKVSNNTDWLGRLCGKLSGREHNQADLWDPLDVVHSMAALDLSVWESAKSVDMRKGVLRT